MNLHQKHCKLLDKVNYARTEEEHERAYHLLNAWREGVTDAAASVGRQLFSLMDGDHHYMDQGINRPMCCGVWLDWKPEGRPESSAADLSTCPYKDCDGRIMFPADQAGAKCDTCGEEFPF